MNLLDNKESVVLTDFLYLKTDGVKISADRCEVYKDFGILLYKGEQLVAHIEDKLKEVSHIDIDRHAHYVIKSTSSYSTYYLVTKEPATSTIVEGSYVSMKGDESRGLILSYLNREDGSQTEEIFSEFKEEKIKENMWEVKTVKSGVMVVVQRGTEIKHVSPEHIMSIEDVKGMGEYLVDLLSKSVRKE